MPRTAYQGVVPFMINGSRVYFHSAHTNLSNFGSQKHAEVYMDEWEAQARYLEFARTYCRGGRSVNNF